MFKNRFFIIFAVVNMLLFAPNYTQAQSKKLLKQYQSAKTLLAQQKYEAARVLFETVYKNPKSTTLIPNALFHIALTYAKVDNLKEAQNHWEKLLADFPNFEAKNEVWYQLADIQFKNKEALPALKILDNITNESLAQDVKSMKGFYLKAMTLPALRTLSKARAKDTFLTQIIVDKIATNAVDEDEIDDMEALIRDLSLEKPAKMRFERKMFAKEHYKIAVMLPFQIDKMKARDTTQDNRISVALYRGMRIAKNELDTLKGAKVKLYAYETNKLDKNKLLQLVADKEFQDIDLVVGNMPDSLYKILADVLPKQKTAFIHPASTDAKILQNPYTYLYESTPETQAQRIIDFLNAQGDNKNIVIFYDNLKKNKNIATLAEQYAKTVGMKVISFVEATPSNLEAIQEVLEKYNRYEVGGIYISSSGNLVAEEIIKHLKAQKYEVPTVVPEGWLRIQSIDYEVLEKLKIHVFYPEYLDTDSTLAFQKAYADLAHQPLPANNDNAHIGYEIVHHFAKIWATAGTQTDFKKTLQKMGVYQGKSGDWLQYTGKQDNQFVPILRFVNNELQLANKPK